MSRRILVTGGCGFIGSNLVLKLVAGGNSVRVLDDMRAGQENYLSGVDVDVIEADLGDSSALAKAMREIDAVVHLAAAGSVVESVANPVANFNSNTAGTFGVLEAARNAGIDRLVFSSTGGALIGNAVPPVNEQSLPKPISPYGASKLAAEAYCHAFAKSYDMHTVVVRFANVYGPLSSHKKGAITVFFRALYNGDPIAIYGDGKASRDFIHVDDICAGLQLALDADVDGGTVMHLATGVETTISELADACRRAAGQPDHPIEFRDRRPGEVERNFATFDYARELMGFSPSIALDDGLAETWKWYLTHVFA